MEINWTNEAIESLIHFAIGVNEIVITIIPIKLLMRQKKTEVFLKENPMLLSKFVEEVKLYKILIMKGKFALYYDFIEEENLIVIKFFRSTKQKPLEQFFSYKMKMITAEFS